MAQLQKLGVEVQNLHALRAKAGLLDPGGVAITLEVSPPGCLNFAALEWKRDDIEVLSVRPSTSNTELVSVYVPQGKLTAFQRRVQAYIAEDSIPKPGKAPRPKHANLINAIISFQRAVFDELWTDEAPASENQQAFQVWLRQGARTAKETFAAFAKQAARLEIPLDEGYVCFPGRVVVLVHSTRSQLQQSLDLLEDVAEIRGTSPSAEYFLSELKPYELADWVKDLAARVEADELSESTPFVTLLDTGVNRHHPLLDAAIASSDLHSVMDEWESHDHDGHGTEMAGLAIHGDLRGPLSSKEVVRIGHRLESIKIWPPQGTNPARLYGWVMNSAAQKVEESNAERRRTFAMMTTAYGATAGMPSEWSATVDRLAFGLTGDSINQFDLPPVSASGFPQLRPRLFVLSAGNIHWDQWHKYPENNDLQTIEDPAQAWNAISVGACTQQVDFNKGKWPGLTAIAPQGGLAPSSRTSVSWSRSWPNKPDVVAEGGNGCRDARSTDSVVRGPEDLRLLTTSHNPAVGLLTESGDTSGAAAEVARICAHVHARYPQLWPETIRALVVNGAQYTPVMMQGISRQSKQLARDSLVRRFGFGKVSLDASLNSTLKRPTLVLQEELIAYTKAQSKKSNGTQNNGTKAKSGSGTRLGKVNIHELPWPKAQLLALGEMPVELKVTLSYFVQPNPSRRGWRSKFRYQSHGLRFSVRGAAESSQQFHQRINKIDREEEGVEESMPEPDSDAWLLRYNVRSRGSLHCDTWTGLATDLANKSELAVFPVGGWWKDMGNGIGADWKVRYALVLSLNVLAESDVDIYTPIANEIGISVGL
ncbi:S8 family peptidase [Piscinibacter sp. HJYY11]|uniref:S8 family peptidase n=1 Tax=Piscinibacter sp. HJYY11 TaxID=2801333 RepID=UPI00191DF093|nr:S8 family peptidase [Piscinibacter sp. HJYY11]MBL0729450.1 S8 family peptidase [Piscinibacter sp. HJYY11]